MVVGSLEKEKRVVRRPDKVEIVDTGNILDERERKIGVSPLFGVSFHFEQLDLERCDLLVLSFDGI